MSAGMLGRAQRELLVAQRRARCGVLVTVYGLAMERTMSQTGPGHGQAHEQA
jgi:hypothetical protein